MVTAVFFRSKDTIHAVRVTFEVDSAGLWPCDYIILSPNHIEKDSQ